MLIFKKWELDVAELDPDALADSGQRRIATAIAQYAVRSGAVTLVGPQDFAKHARHIVDGGARARRVGEVPTWG